MGIIKPAPPEVVEKLAKASLVHLSRPVFGKSAAVLQRTQNSARVAEPLEVFYLGLSPMVGDPTLAGAEAIAWRFFVLSGRRAVASTEIAIARQEQGGAPFWSHLSYDPRLQTQLSVIRRVERNPRYKTASYELRFLRIPALDLSALLWLRPVQGGGDFLIPMGSHPLLRPGWQYSVPKLFNALEGHARRRLTTSCVPKRL